MFDYNICPNNNSERFNQVCSIIEKEYPTCKKKKLLVDVDGTTIQTFALEEKDIDIYNDFDIGAVYVKSEINLDNILLA